MSGPSFAKDYAPQLVQAKYGYLARALKAGMTAPQMREAIVVYQKQLKAQNVENFGELTTLEITQLVNNYEVIASSSDPSFSISSGLDAVIFRSRSSNEILVSIGGVGPTSSDYVELVKAISFTSIYGFEVQEYVDLSRMYDAATLR
jgi:hypothetical protein